VAKEKDNGQSANSYPENMQAIIGPAVMQALFGYRICSLGFAIITGS
jgi:hypothetical protein